ncbi:MAG: hypothetical protein NTW21_17525 [Verrucomicrobia bacterium]|nr:hypothetical protein [Verrucomicrobiota bacterium]
MKATLEIPDDLYRRVKARSALEGRPIRLVAVQLFQAWLEAPAPPQQAAPPEETLTEADFERFPWLKTSRKYLKPGMSHDMDDIKEAIARGSAAEYAEKLAANRS